jgi:peptidoglycan/xylan/chitin deacetylase (PgdA/CDA1 family)
MQYPEPYPSQDVCEGDTQSIRTLVYHRITSNRLLAKANARCVHESEFQRHLDMLDRWGFTTITFNDYQLFLENSLHLPRKPVILTIEGAYPDTYEVAFRVLRESGCKAVIFALAAPSGESEAGAPDHPMSSQMTLDQLREIFMEGMEVGSLSVSYANLSAVHPDLARDEIVQSKAALEKLLDTRILTFAYPYGAVNDQTKSMVAEAKYAFACSWSSGPLRFDADPFEIRRFSVRGGIGALELGTYLRIPQLAHALWRSDK